MSFFVAAKKRRTDRTDGNEHSDSPRNMTSGSNTGGMEIECSHNNY